MAKKSDRKTSDDYHVDPQRPWLIVSDDGKESAVLMAKDINALTAALQSVKDVQDNKSARKTFKQFLELIDFAPVTIDERHHALWKQGSFVGKK